MINLLGQPPNDINLPSSFNGASRVNDLNVGSKYQRIEVVANVTNKEWEMATHYDTYFKEMLQNYKRVAGYLYSEADLEKLNEEERPKFVYNLLLPIILQLSGNFANNQSRVEAIPRTPGDTKMALIMSDLLDYAHYTANDLQKELSIAFTNAIIGRVGWVAQDWSYATDPEGMLDITSVDPFRVLWEFGITRRNLKDCNYLFYRGWYTPEEMRNIFALEDDELWDTITEMSKLYLGSSDKQRRKIIPYLERTFGPVFGAYKGKEQGYDEITSLINGNLHTGSTYFDAQYGLFKVVEFHERRQDKFFTLYDTTFNRKYDITSVIGATKDGKTYDNAALAQVRDAFIQRGREPVVKQEIINQIYQTAVCPAFNIVLYEAPYAVQNNNFKLTPIFCFDFGNDSLDWKSYVDHLVDPVSAYNLEMNTIQTYLMKTAHGETWAEEGAIEEYEDAWLQNKIGDIKYIKPGKFDKVARKEPPSLPLGLTQNSAFKRDLIKEISGVRDNALGTQETSGESGKLYQSRVQQSDILQNVVQDNAIGQLKMIGENSKDFMIHYMEPGRVIRITRDESNPYWVEINEGGIRKLFITKEGDIDKVEYLPGNMFESKYDISISKAPFGEAAKQREFQELMMLTETAMKVNPAYVKFEYLVKNSRLRQKDEWLQHIRMQDQSTLMVQQAQAQQAMVENQMNILNQGIQAKGQLADMEDKRKESESENFIRDNITRMVTE